MTAPLLITLAGAAAAGQPLRTLHLFASAGGSLYADLILGHRSIDRRRRA